MMMKLFFPSSNNPAAIHFPGLRSEHREPVVLEQVSKLGVCLCIIRLQCGKKFVDRHAGMVGVLHFWAGLASVQIEQHTEKVLN